MFSESNKFLFIHIPKTAGTSIMQHLIPYCDTNEFNKNKQSVKYKDKDIKHHRLFQYYNIIPNIEEYNKFTIVRNVYDRCLSAYIFFGEMKEYVNDPEYFRNDKEFIKFLRRQEYYSAGLKRTKRRVVMSNQVEFICKPYGRIDNQVMVGRFENLKHDFSLICDKLNIPRCKKLEHRNSRGRKKHYSEYYCKEAKEIVDRLYSTDIEFFNFKFEGEEQCTKE